jgi:2-oxoglutarate dehydrogenase E2 component (dihydrolipoamide succinyltransferase)
LLTASSSDPTPKQQEANEEPAELSKESKTKDLHEPKDQQVEKGTPSPPPPAKEDARKKVQEPKKEKPKDSTAAAEAPKVPGSRNETRVCPPSQALIPL